jgi:hypothetical protein
METWRAKASGLTEDFLWAVILVPILAISWIGFYTIARAVGVPTIFAAGMSAAFDGVALFAARIGLKHRRKGFSGYLARITVVSFAALGAFVQSFHGRSQTWIHAHDWIVWATVPIAACLAYELHLGWVHRKQLIRNGYVHPSAKSGYGPATWILTRGTFGEYRAGLRARRAFISAGNLSRFQLEEARQPTIAAAVPPKAIPPAPPVQPTLHSVPNPKRKSARSSGPTPARTAGSARPTTPRRTTGQVTRNMAIREWAQERDYELGYNARIPIKVLNEYRAWIRTNAQARTA